MVQILVRYRVSFSTAVVPQLQLWHLQWLVSVQFVRDLHLQVLWIIRDEWQYAPLKRRSTIILHGSITQKTALNIILAAVRT
jgi:hypothetical protein